MQVRYQLRHRPMNRFPAEATRLHYYTFRPPHDQGILIHGRPTETAQSNSSLSQLSFLRRFPPYPPLCSKPPAAG